MQFQMVPNSANHLKVLHTHPHNGNLPPNHPNPPPPPRFHQFNLECCEKIQRKIYDIPDTHRGQYLTVHPGLAVIFAPNRVTGSDIMS